jgi:hypothetical protein
MSTYESKESIEAYAGDQVIVAISEAGTSRKGYWPQMSIQGTLEQLDDSDSFRVVLSDNTYTYFTSKNVYLINPLTGPYVILNIEIDTPAEAME